MSIKKKKNSDIFIKMLIICCVTGLTLNNINCLSIIYNYYVNNVRV